VEEGISSCERNKYFEFPKGYTGTPGKPSQRQMLVIDCGSEYTSKIVEHLFSLGHKPCVVRLEFLQKEHVFGMPGAIISGSQNMLSEFDDDFFGKYGFLMDLEVPLLGICFGHQLIGLLHGAEISSGDMIHRKIDVWLENDPLFAGIDSVALFMQRHREHITLPRGFVCIGSSDYSPVEAMRHRSKPIYSVQFHPEISGSTGLKVLENFSKLCVETVPYNEY